MTTTIAANRRTPGPDAGVHAWAATRIAAVVPGGRGCAAPTGVARGVPQHDVTPSRLVGVALLVAGLLLVSRR